MKWTLKYLPEAAKDFKNLAGNQRIMVAKAIDKVLENPLPVQEGGYGKPLGNKHGNDLSGLLKIKLRGAGIRVVYKLIRTESEMLDNVNTTGFLRQILRQTKSEYADL